MKRIKLGLIFCASLALGSAANAELKTMVVTGTVETIDVELASGPFSFGDPVTAVITYDDAAPDECPADAVSGCYDIISYGFTVGGYSGSDDGHRITVVNDFVNPTSTRDEIRINASTPFVTSSNVAGLPLAGFGVIARGPETIFLTDALPETLNVGDFTFDDGPNFNLFFDDGGPAGEPLPRVTGPIDSITISPTVSTIFVSGDNTPVFYAAENDNDLFFINILQDGDTVAVQSMPTGTGDDSVNAMYDSLPGVASSLIAAPTAGALAGVDLFLSILPETAYTATEIADMANFLLGGGSILFAGESSGIAAGRNEIVNAALTGLGSSLSILPANFDIGDHFATGLQIAEDAFTAGVGSLHYGSASEVVGGTALFFTTTGEPFVAYEAIGAFDPDSDGDGIVDSEDSCPDLKQPVDFSGPEPVLLDPDSDDDGFGDMCDECPQEFALQDGPCLASESDTLVKVDASTTGPLLLRWDIDFGEVVTVYKPSCGKTVTFEGLPQSAACTANPSLPECQPLGVILRQTAQVTPDDLVTVQFYSVTCDLRLFLRGLDPEVGEKQISVVARFTSEGKTSFDGVPIEQLTITSDPVLVTRSVPPTTAEPNPAPINTDILLTAIAQLPPGGSTIAGAELTVDGGVPAAMVAADGSFDEPIESVKGLIPAFSTAGVHEVCVVGIDELGNRSDADCLLLAVFDPSGGFVTGGGWIDSPPGAYTPDDPNDPDVIGKASFGFVSKYRKGRQAPEGETEFQFSAGDLNFHSASYEWLVISGSRAQYKGEGSVNGVPGFGFMLTAIDADRSGEGGVDRFRMKIIDKASGTQLYDNQPGSSDDSDDTTELGGGAILIHTEKRR